MTAKGAEACEVFLNGAEALLRAEQRYRRGVERRKAGKRLPILQGGAVAGLDVPWGAGCS